MNIKHVFKSECPNIEDLFENCSTLDAYFEKLNKQADIIKTSHYVEHGFECLVEAIIKCERRVMKGVKKYNPLPTCNNDMFVNGVGVKSEKEKVAVMICTVKDIERPLTANANHLTTFTSNAVEHYGVNPDGTKVFRIFTNAKMLHENTQEQFFNDKSVRFYLKPEIEEIINGNQKFWISFKNSMKGINKVSPKEIILREYQEDASASIFTSQKGQIILPTGTGKSIIATDAIYNELKHISKKSPCILIMTPRIVLTYQLLGDIVDYLKMKKMDAQYLNLNSGKFDDDVIKEAMVEMGLPIRDIPSTTTVKEIEYYYDKAIKDGVPFIISATYQSAPRILSTKIPIHMAIHDEAHNLVDGIGRFSTEAKIDVLRIEGAKEIFLTATPAYSDSDEGTGMNNEKEYGTVIYRKSPKEMIDMGEIVPPYIHQVVIDEYKIKEKNVVLTDNLLNTDLSQDVEFMGIVIEEAFDKHCIKLKEYSYAPNKIGAKMLVVCSGDNTFQGFFNSKSFEEIKNKRKDIKFFGISSRFGAWIDGEHMPVQGGNFKEQFMMALKNLKSEENAIILHIDMIGEGVDIPGITGVLPFRELGVIKSCQTLGRAMRLMKEDRISFYNGSRGAREVEKMIKPYAWVILPVYSFNHKNMEEKVVEIAEKIRGELGYMPFENSIVNNVSGGPKMPLMPTDPATGKRPDEANIRHIVENPYFIALTTNPINDSVNGENDDLFEVIRKVWKND